MPLLTLFLCLMPAFAHAQTQRIVALGDSLTSGYGLESGKSFAAALESALKDAGRDVRVDNAGVSGDTTAGGLARLDWAIAGEPKPTLVIVALGGNDLLRGLDPDMTRKNLDAILTKLQAQDIPALLAGMRSPPNMGAAYQRRFDAVYTGLIEDFDVAYYPFFLEGVAMNPQLNLPDGVHPTAEGVDIMVRNILPVVLKALDR